VEADRVKVAVAARVKARVPPAAIKPKVRLSLAIKPRVLLQIKLRVAVAPQEEDALLLLRVNPASPACRATYPSSR
jgi:hypothetical protein